MTLEIASKRDLPNCMYGYKRRAIARRQIARWASHLLSGFFYRAVELLEYGLHISYPLACTGSGVLHLLHVTARNCAANGFTIRRHCTSFRSGGNLAGLLRRCFLSC